MDISRRFFLKSFLNYIFVLSLSIIVNDTVLQNVNMKFISEKFYLMGTYGKIQLFVDDVDHGTRVLKKALDKIKYIESLLTKFSPDSDIGVINNFSKSYHYISDDTLHILDYGTKLSEMTFGYFDMGLGNVLSKIGIDGTVPLVGKITKLNDMSGDLLYIHGNNVKLRRKNVMLDLGGIGKGYALDEAMNVFLTSGIKHVAIEFGGDIKVNAGMPSGLPWMITYDDNLSHFLKSDSNFIKLYTGSLAVSGGYLKRSHNFSTYHHIIDPKSLKSKNNFFAIFVSGKDGVICDVLSTACYNMDYVSLHKVKNTFSDYDIKTYV